MVNECFVVARQGQRHLAIEAATHGTGIALGDTMTTSRLLSRGALVVPFDLSVPAADAFFIACRSEMRVAPIAQTFIDWLIAAVEEEDTKAGIVARERPNRRLKRAVTARA